MRASTDRLKASLQRNLAPIYLIFGEEPLQLMEAQDEIRAAARAQNYSSREVLEVGNGFDWSHLRVAANNLSLFAERRIIELRIPSGKPGKEGGEALSEYAERLPADTLLMIACGKLDKAAQSSKWFKALDDAGVVIQIWPMKVTDLPAWIQRRMQAKGIRTNAAGISVLADRVEGNLLAAAQEIEKLALLYGKSGLQAEVDERQVIDAVSDSSRYNVYDLMEAALLGQIARSMKILKGLEGESVAPALILWVLSSEIRAIRQYAEKLANGQSRTSVLSSVWQNRRPLVETALKRLPLKVYTRLLKKSAVVDQVVKGVRRGSVWFELQKLVLGLAGVPDAV